MDGILDCKKPFVLFLVGSPGSGKSHCVKYICRELSGKGKVEHILCMSGGNLDDYSFLPEDVVKNEFDEEMVKKLIRVQKKNGNPPALLILDDMVGKNVTNNQVFKHLISTHRQINLSIICVTQYLNTELSPLMRNCTTHCGWFKQEQKRAIQALHESYGQRHESYNLFKEKCMDILHKHEFCVFDPSKEGLAGYQVYKIDGEIPEFNISF